jgi:hypothetical protein
VFDQNIYLARLAAVDQAQTNNEKGNSFEQLAAYLLSGLEGVEVRDTNVNLAAEEIDILLWNAGIEEVLRPWDGVILVECKNWSAPVGAQVLGAFLNKLHQKHLKTGIFVAANGVTGDFVNGNHPDIGAVRMIYDALVRDGTRVIVLRLDDIRNCIWISFVSL